MEVFDQNLVADAVKTAIKLVLRPKHLIPGEGRKCLERRNTNKDLAGVPG